MARRLYTDNQPAYRRRMRRIYGGSAGLVILLGAAATYLAHQAYFAERAEWWIGIVAALGAGVLAAYLANRWRAHGAR
jgi:uncharacterized membrane protein